MSISLRKVSGYQSVSWWCSGRGSIRNLFDWDRRWTSLEPKHHTPSSTSYWTQVLFYNQFPSSISTSVLFKLYFTVYLLHRTWDNPVLIITYSHWLQSWCAHYHKHTSSHESPIWWLNALALFSYTTTMKYRGIFHGHKKLALHSNIGLSCNHRMYL